MWGGGHSKAVCCETKKFTTALKLQIILLSLLVTCAAALFCLPAKNAYADEITIDGVTYSYEILEEDPVGGVDPDEVGTVLICNIWTDKASVVVPERIANRYVTRIGIYGGETEDCSSPGIVSLDVSNCSALKFLSVSDFNFHQLGVSENTALEELNCQRNNLTSLDVSNNTSLKWLNCSENKLTSLDLSKNTKLNSLYCSNNKLNSLDVSTASLCVLHCDNNELSSLDISNCKALYSLDCSNNHISDTSKLLAWLQKHPSTEFYDNKVLPQKVSGDSGNTGNTGNSGNAGNAGNNGDNNTPAAVTGTWKHNSKGWWYAYSNGTYAKGMKKIGGATYYFDSKGWMKTGWQHATGNSDWHYFNKSGAMKTGWLKSSGKWYYLNPLMAR